MLSLLRPIFAAAVALAPAAALAQYIVPEPSVALVPAPPEMAAPAGPLSAEDAAMIAMANGMATVEDVDVRMWDGNYKVEGTDMTGEDLVMRIDRDTGQILDIDD